MTDYRFSNNAQTTLALAATAGATSITVASATPFPVSGDFTIIVDSEIMLVTGVAGTTWTVARAQEGTSAASHISGSPVLHVLTAEFLNSISAHSTGTSFPVSPASGDRFFRTDLGGEYYYNGARWVSAWVEVVSIAHQGAVNPITVTSTTWGGLPPLDVLLDAVSVTFFVSTTNDASNHWSFTLHYTDQTTITQVGAAITTVGGGVGSYNTSSWLTLNLVLAASIDSLYIVATKIGSPGSCYVMANGRYRLIAT